MNNIQMKKAELEALKDEKKLQFNRIRTELLEYLLYHYGIKLEEFINNYSRRTIELVIVRQIMMIKANEFGYSLARAGAFYGKDHSTVVHAKKTIKNYADTDKNFAKFMNIVNLYIEELLIKLNDD